MRTPLTKRGRVRFACSVSLRSEAREKIMNNANWVCFDCRTSQRRASWRLLTFYKPWLVGDTWGGAVKCPECQNPCKFLGHKIAIPPQRDDAAWKELRDYVTARYRTHFAVRAEASTRRKHEIERRILELQSRSDNKERKRLIQILRDELDSIPNA